MNEMLSPLTDGFESQIAPKESYTINKLLCRVTHGFDTPHSP